MDLGQHKYEVIIEALVEKRDRLSNEIILLKNQLDGAYEQLNDVAREYRDYVISSTDGGIPDDGYYAFREYLKDEEGLDGI